MIQELVEQPVKAATISERRVTLADVARAAGVSKPTASQALSGKSFTGQATREVVIEVARRLGYQPNPHAQRLANGRSHDTIELLSVRSGTGMDVRKMQLIQSLLFGQGYTVPIHSYTSATVRKGDLAMLIGRLRRQQPRAIVCDISSAEMEQDAEQEIQRYQDEGGLMVRYGYGSLSVPCDQVVLDGSAGVQDAMRHLLELGHRRIGFYSVAFHNEEMEDAANRTLDAEAVQLKPEWLCHRGESDAEESDAFGVRMAEAFLKLPHSNRPSAVLIVNDLAALSFIGTVVRAGVAVPEQLSVVGYDDIPLAAHGLLPLTTITHPAEAMAQRVVEMLGDRLHSRYEGAPREEVLRGQLQVRNSTGPPPAH